MHNIKYLGVYSGAINPRKTGSQQQQEYWYMWFIPDEQRYIMKSLDPKSPVPPCFISAMQFGLNFLDEKNISLDEPEMPDPATLESYKKTTSAPASSESRDRFKTPLATPTQSTTEAPVTAQKSPFSTKKSAVLENKIEEIRVTRIERELRLGLDDAMALWSKGKKEGAIRKFDEMLELDEDFVPGHKHVFTECSVALRKIKQNEKALAFALRSIEISPDDENTYFNVARMYYELHEYDEAHRYILRCLELDPELKQAIKLESLLSGLVGRHHK